MVGGEQEDDDDIGAEMYDNKWNREWTDEKEQFTHSRQTIAANKVSSPKRDQWTDRGKKRVTVNDHIQVSRKNVKLVVCFLVKPT